MLVYDTTDEISFQGLSYWTAKMSEYKKNKLTRSVWINIDQFTVFKFANKEFFFIIQSSEFLFFTYLLSKALPNSVIILAGNKADKKTDRKVSVQKAVDFCKLHNIYKHIEVSALDGTNVAYVF